MPRIDTRIKKLEFIDEFATEPVRGILYICEDLAGDVCEITVGADQETMERYQTEAQESFRQRIEARMNALYQQDRKVPVAYLIPEATACDLK